MGVESGTGSTGDRRLDGLTDEQVRRFLGGLSDELGFIGTFGTELESDLVGKVLADTGLAAKVTGVEVPPAVEAELTR